jgi:hypothetical protein
MPACHLTDFVVRGRPGTVGPSVAAEVEGKSSGVGDRRCRFGASEQLGLAERLVREACLDAGTPEDGVVVVGHSPVR